MQQLHMKQVKTASPTVTSPHPIQGNLKREPRRRQPPLPTTTTTTTTAAATTATAAAATTTITISMSTTITKARTETTRLGFLKSIGHFSMFHSTGATTYVFATFCAAATVL